MAEFTAETPIVAAFLLPLDADQLNWIGTLAALWSQLEFLSELWIYHLRGQSFSEGRREGVPRDISQRLGKLRALAGDNLGGDQRRIVVALCDRGTVAAPKRNLALHGNWMLHHGLGVVAAVSWFKVTLDEPLQALPIDDLPPLVLEVGQVGRIMLDLLVKRGAELPGPGTQLGA